METSGDRSRYFGRFDVSHLSLGLVLKLTRSSVRSGRDVDVFFLSLFVIFLLILVIFLFSFLEYRSVRETEFRSRRCGERRDASRSRRGPATERTNESAKR
jgi:hypothetical protein